MRAFLAAAFFAVLATPALADRAPAPEGAEAYIVSPSDGATLSNPVTVVFGLRNMGIAPAGLEAENTGHHHLMINMTPDEIVLDEPLPATDQLRHFGGGQTETTLELPAGEHTLRLIVADYRHIPHDPPIISEPITITID